MMQPRVDAELGYRLHLLGLAGGSLEVQPGYLRTEEKLRKQVPRGLVGWLTVDEALAASDVPASDRAWFDKRWAMGEGTEATTLAASIAALGWDVSIDAALVVSPALRALPCLAPTTRTVAVGAGTLPTLAALGGVALDLEARYPAALAADTKRFAAWMWAGSLVTPRLASDALDRLLIDATQYLLPPQHRQDELEHHVLVLARAKLLDQPPGEIERTIHGLGRRRADRLHRAWTRGFFVPRGSSDPPTG